MLREDIIICYKESSEGFLVMLLVIKISPQR